MYSQEGPQFDIWTHPCTDAMFHLSQSLDFGNTVTTLIVTMSYSF